MLSASCALQFSCHNQPFNVVVSLTPGNGKLTHLPIKEVLIFNRAFFFPTDLHFTDAISPTFCGLEKRGGGGGRVGDVTAARLLFLEQILLPLSLPNLQ